MTDKPAFGEWLPIETAPKDGTRLILFFPWKGGITFARWDRNLYQSDLDWTCDDGEAATLLHDPPTHWMPLPRPPKG